MNAFAASKALMPALEPLSTAPRSQLSTVTGAPINSLTAHIKPLHITFAIAPATTSKFLLFKAAMQIRPESNP